MRTLFVSNGHFDSALPLLKHLSRITDCTLNVQIECNEFQESICDTPLKQDSVGVDVHDGDTEVIEGEIRRLVGLRLGISFTKYPSRSFRDPRNWIVSGKWVRWAARNRFDVVNYNGTSMLFLQQILADQRSQKVFTIHDHVNHLGESAPQVRWLYRYMAWRRRHRFIAQSDFVRRGFSAEYDVNLQRISTVRFGALELFRNWDDNSIVEEPATVLFLGRISPYKGLEYLARAWKDVRGRVPGARLIIAGNGTMYFDTTELRADQSVEIINRHIENAELAQLMKRSSVVVIPYVEATQSGVVMTAYAFGKPVVATSVGGIPEVVEEGETGYLVPPKDFARLADALVRILSSAAIRREMRKNIEQRVKTEFSWERIARQTLDEYELSLGKTGASM